MLQLTIKNTHHIMNHYELIQASLEAFTFIVIPCLAGFGILVGFFFQD